ncbi:MAG: hypothetical protein WD595_05100 [Waddliaceae bacterium]
MKIIDKIFLWLSYVGAYVHLFFTVLIFAGIGYTTHQLPFTIFGGTLLAIFLRLNDDLQDVHQDRIAHPQRPFPKGVLTLKEGNAIWWLLFHALWMTALVFLFFGKIFFLIVFILLLGILKIAPSLRSYPVAKSLLNQTLILPFALFNPFYALLLFGAFATYDLTRKLDPKIHPILVTPIHYWGYSSVYWFCVGTLAISFIGALLLGVQIVLFPMQFIVLLSLLIPFTSPKLWEVPHFLALISLIVHAWCGIFL